MADIIKITIKAGKHEFELSLEEIKSLRDILNSTFPEPKTTYIPYTPTIIERYPYPRSPWWTYTTSGTTATLCLSNKTDDND